MFSFTNVIHIIVIFQGSLLSLYIFSSNRKKATSDRLLGLIIAVLSVQILGLFLANREIEPEFFQSVNAMYGFLYGPLLFFYTRSITRSDFQVKAADFYHFLPAFGILIALFLFKDNLRLSYIYTAYVLHILSYLVYGVREVLRYKKAVKDNYSKLEWLNVGWLQGTFVVFSLIVLADVFQFLVFLVQGDSYPLENIVFLLILAAINLLYFRGFIPVRDLTGINSEDLALSSSISMPNSRQSNSEETKALLSKLSSHIQQHKPYKNPHLTIAMMATELEIPKRTLSELINDHHQQNFVDFINTHRIELAKYRFQHPIDPQETILEVMYEVGFNSKSSFNTAFKKKTGLTPSQYKAQFK